MRYGCGLIEGEVCLCKDWTWWQNQLLDCGRASRRLARTSQCWRTCPPCLQRKQPLTPTAPAEATEWRPCGQRFADRRETGPCCRLQQRVKQVIAFHPHRMLPIACSTSPFDAAYVCGLRRRAEGEAAACGCARS